jgi:hypothetical protein
MRKLNQAYLYSAGAVLLAMATALFLTNLRGYPLDFVPVRDPVFSLPMPKLFWLVGALLLGVALYCLFGQNTATRLGMVAWLLFNVMVLVFALPALGIRGGLKGYLGGLADTFGMSPGGMAGLVLGASGCLLIGGVTVMILNWLEERSDRINRRLKITCADCGGHIAFSAQNLGLKIPCPHCQATVTLRKDEYVKMSCFFCKGHIQFPAHALGTKMQCPHCKMDITLKELG